MKKVTITLCSLLTLATGYSQVPGFSWEHSFTANFAINEYKADTSGNIILAGNAAGTVDFDPGPGVSSWTTPNNPPCCPTEDGFIAKYSRSGALQWKILFSSSNNEAINSMALDEAGNIYVNAVGTDTTADLDPGPGTYFLNRPGGFMAKFSPAGSLLWIDELDIYAAKMFIDPVSNDLLLAGTFYDTIDIDPSAAVLPLIGSDPGYATFFMARFNSSGQLIWANDFNDSSIPGNSMTTVAVRSDLAGNIFIAGKITGTVDADPSAAVASVTNSNYIAKYNSSGQLLLLQSYIPEIYSFDLDSGNNIAIGGWFVGIVDFDPGAGIQSLNAGPASSDFFLTKYDNNLNYIWAFTHSNTPNSYSQIQSLDFDSNDDLIVYGNYDLPFGASDFDPGAGIYTVPIGTGNFIARYSSTSDLISFADVNGITANNVATTHLNKTDNKLFLSGYAATPGTIDFDLGSGTFNKTFAYNEKFLARYDLTCSSSPTYASDTTCYGDTLFFGTTGLCTTGLHSVLLTSSSGCDSTVAVDLFVKPQILTTPTIVLCSGQSYYFNGSYINTPGIYQDTLAAFNGCDSIVNLTLSIIPVNYTVTQSGNVLSSAETSATGYQWYNCTTGASVAGATGIAFSVSNTADYAVIISKSGCLDTTTCMNVTVPVSAGYPPVNIWGNQFSLNAQFYKVDKNGNSYLAGSLLPQVDLDPDTGVFMPPYDIYGMYLLKYSSSGSFLWAKWIQTASGNYIVDMEVDSTGAVYFTGVVSSSVDMDAGPGTASISPSSASDIFLCKYNSAGTFQWVHDFGTSGYNNPFALAIDRSNNVYMTGYFEDDIDFDAGPGVQIISTAGGNIFNFIVKYGSSGNYISGSGIDSWVQIEKLTIDNADNIIYAGSFWDAADIDPGAGTFMVNDLSSGSQQNSFIAKVDQSYNFIAGAAISSDQLIQISDITTSLSNDLLVTGYYRSSLNDFVTGTGSYSLPYTGNDDVYIASFSPSGNFQWAKQVANMNPDYSTTVVTDLSANAYVLGKYSGTIDADGTPGMLLLTCSGTSDNYVATYDPAGNFNWAFRVGSPSDDDPVGMGLDGTGNLYLAGNSMDSVSFMTGINNDTRMVMNGVYIAKYGQCTLPVNTVTDNGAYFTSNDTGGEYQWYDCSTGSPIPGAAAQSFYPSAAGQYSVLVGTGACSVMSSCYTFIGPTSADLNPADEQMIIFPNPANDKITILTEQAELVSMTDMAGRIVLRIEAGNSGKTVEINISQLSNGIYMVNITMRDGKRRTEKIIISR